MLGLERHMDQDPILRVNFINLCLVWLLDTGHCFHQNFTCSYSTFQRTPFPCSHCILTSSLSQLECLCSGVSWKSNSTKHLGLDLRIVHCIAPSMLKWTPLYELVFNVRCGLRVTLTCTDRKVLCYFIFTSIASLFDFTFCTKTSDRLFTSEKTLMLLMFVHQEEMQSSCSSAVWCLVQNAGQTLLPSVRNNILEDFFLTYP